MSHILSKQDMATRLLLGLTLAMLQTNTFFVIAIHDNIIVTEFGKSPIWVHLTPKIFNDQITNVLLQMYMLMVLCHSQYLKLQENS